MAIQSRGSVFPVLVGNSRLARKTNFLLTEAPSMFYLCSHTRTRERSVRPVEASQPYRPTLRRRPSSRWREAKRIFGFLA